MITQALSNDALRALNAAGIMPQRKVFEGMGTQ